MREFIVMGKSVVIKGGLIALSEVQAGKRKHKIQATKEPGIYEILKPITFKQGEVIGLRGDLGKELLSVLQEPLPAKEEEEGEAAQENKGGKAEASDVTVKELSEALGHSALKDTITLLSDSYKVKLKVGKDLIPKDVLERVKADFNLVEEEEEGEACE